MSSRKSKKQRAAGAQNAPSNPGAQNKPGSASGGVSIPLPLRVGGAFMALALVLVIMAAVAMITEGVNAPFAFTWPRVALVVAALIVGAFATVRKDQKASRTQVVALVVAVALIIGSRFLPATVLTVMGQYWLFMYAGAAFLCAIIIRRTIAPPAK